MKPRRKSPRIVVALIAFGAIALGAVAAPRASFAQEPTPPRSSVDLSDASVEGALRLIADIYDLSLATGPLPDLRISLRLRDVTADEALDAVATAADLSISRRGNVIQVRPSGPVEDGPAPLTRRLLSGPFPPDAIRALEGLTEVGITTKRITDDLIVIEGKNVEDVEAAAAIVRDFQLAEVPEGGSAPGDGPPPAARQVVMGPFPAPVRGVIDDLESAGLTVRRGGESLVIFEGDVDEVELAVAAIRDATQAIQRQAITERVFRLGFASGPDTLAAIQPLLQPDLEAAAYDENGHLLTVRALPETLEKVDAVIAAREEPPVQIEIEARVYEVSDEDLERFGAEWAVRFGARGGRFPTTFPLQDFDDRSDFIPSVNDLANLPTIVNVVQQLDNLQAGTLFDPGFIFGSVDASETSIFLEFLAQTGNIKIVATPKVHAIQNRPASIEIVDTIRVPLLARNDNLDVQVIDDLEEIDIGTTLEVTPRLGRDGTIHLNVKPEVSESVADFSGFPVVSRRTATTEVILDEGETLVIAGLLREREIHRIRKIPGIGDVPILGRAFRIDDYDESKTELFVFLTPRRLPSAAERRHLKRVDDRWISKEAARRLGLARVFIKSPDPEERLSAVKTLAAIDAELTEARLDVETDIEPMKDDESPAVRAAAARFYVQRRPAMAFRKLEAFPDNRALVADLLAEPIAPHLRAGLASWLRQGSLQGAVEERFLAAEAQDDSRVAAVLLEALAVTASDRAVRHARRIAADSAPRALAVAAIDVLAAAGGPDDVDGLTSTALSSPRAENRIRAMTAMYRLVGPAKAEAAFLEAARSRGVRSARHRVEGARRAAARALPYAAEGPLAWSKPAFPIQVTGPEAETAKVEAALDVLGRDAPDYRHFVETAFGIIEAGGTRTDVDAETRTLYLATRGANPERLAHRLVHHARAVYDARVGGFPVGGGRAVAASVREEIAALERLSGTRCPDARLDRTVGQVLGALAPQEAAP